VDLRARLIEEFRSKRLRSGQPIESIRAIAERFGIGKSAAEKVVRSLIADGICRAQHGRGVFLAVDDPQEVKASKLIGVVSGYSQYPLADNVIYRQMFAGLDRWIVGQGHNALTLHHWRNKPVAQKSRELAQYAPQVAGLAAVGIYNDATCILLRNSGLPLVVIDYDASPLGVDSAVTDSLGAARLLGEAIMARGVERAFHVRWRRDGDPDPAREERLEGLRQSLVARLVGPVEMANQDHAEPLAQIARAVRDGPGRTAVVCDDHAVVPGAMRILDELGLAPGRDFLLGYVGPRLAPQETPAWPALVAAFDFETMGQGAGRLLDRRIKAGPGRPERMVLPAEMVELVATGTKAGGAVS
jgi:DNA-binding LacI/PurR family transcriptional regulator